MLALEVGQAFLSVAGVLLVIVVADRLVRYLSHAAAGKIPGDLIFVLLGLKTIVYVILVIPPALFFAILLALGRMYRESEMVALAASGIGALRVYRGLLWLALPISFSVGLLTLYAVPWAVQLGESILIEQLQKADLNAVQTGRFNEYGDGNIVYYIEQLSPDRQQMVNVFIQNRQHGRLGLVLAQSGYQYVDEQTGNRFAVLINGYRYEGHPGEATFRIVQFEKYALLISRTADYEAATEPRAQPSSALWEAGDLGSIAELQWRLSAPIAVMVLVVLAVPLSKTSPREGKYIRLFVAVPLYFAYANLQSVAQAWVERGLVPLWMGLWWVHLLMLLIAAGLLWRERGPRQRPVRPSLPAVERP